MAIAGALIVPIDREHETDLVSRLERLPEVAVQETGPKGIAVVLEAAAPQALKRISQRIAAWEEVLDFQLAYLNWEEPAGEEQTDS